MAQLDLAFCCDCTGSMSAYLKSAQENILKIAEEISVQAKANIRYALVKYRDHPPQDSTFVVETFPFTEDIQVMKRNVDTMKAQGGGDGPEAVADGLHEVLELEWRPNSTKVCVLISDAPPHGLGEDGDGFVDGCPCGHDPLDTARKLAQKGVIVYSVGVEPVLSTSYKFARDFMIAVAKTTEGQFLPLGKAEILAKVVVNGALEGVNMDEVWAKMEKDIKDEAEKKGIQMDEATLHARVTEAVVASDGIKGAHIEVENPYYNAGYDHYNCDRMQEATSLADVRQKLESNRNAAAAQQAQQYQWQEQKASYGNTEWSYEQKQRVQQKAAKSKGLFDWK